MVCQVSYDCQRSLCASWGSPNCVCAWWERHTRPTGSTTNGNDKKRRLEAVCRLGIILDCKEQCYQLVRASRLLCSFARLRVSSGIVCFCVVCHTMETV